MGNDLIRLADLSAKLQELTGDRGPGYRKVLELALDAAFPSVLIGNRRYVREPDMPGIVHAVGLTMTADRAVA